MTTVNSSPFLEKPAAPDTAPAAPDRWDRAEAALERAGERLNPILVKEARQALKSKQFVVTFTLLLMCGWGWSLLGIALISPGVYYAPAGPFMLIGYYFVLAVPLLVVVPFAAFRSLASEREDGTYELLSITALSPRLIISGKLGSAVLQMIVYYSALTPCIVFTYILRGVDIVSIGIVLFWTFLFSVGLSVVGLLFATATRSRNWQVLFSVVFLLALLFVGFLWSLAVVQILGYGGTPAYDEPDFWLAMAACLTAYVAFFVLFIQAAAAQIMFVSANRSTALRATMFVHQLLWAGWIMFFWIRFELDELFLVMMTFAALYWAIMGALMTGEAPQLSPRARRSLPQSFLGRAFLTWLNPGSGTGYAFAVSNLFALAVLSLTAGAAAHWLAFDGKPDEGWWPAFSLMAVAYVAAYLGLGRLVLLFLRRFVWGGLPMAFVVQLFVAAMGALLPFLIQFTSRWGAFIDEYTLLQVPNWAWTMYAIADEDLSGADLAVYAIVPSVAVVIFVINMLFAARELAAEREQTPQRVIEDEIQLHPEKAPKPPGPQSPWDYDAPAEPAAQ
jgi:ABC-type transport system involved in multi-copper enzyme maturation permease subunit